MKSVIEITKEVADYFTYDESSKSCLIRSSDSREVGGIDLDKRHGKYKRWRVSIPNIGVLLAHRVVWVLNNGVIPLVLEIDHIDGNALNNKIQNLRLSNRNIATRNLSMKSTNKTGVTGVTYRYNLRTNCEMYIAIWKEYGKDMSKAFSFSKYGKDRAFELACEVRRKAVDRLRSKGEDYSETHGEARNQTVVSS
jgi:hypothetical protein